MKNSLSLLAIFIVLIVAYSCTQRTNRTLLPELEHVENIMYAYPDSALKTLEQMKTPKISDRLNHATWCLFLAQAKYKNYIKQPSDSLINIAYEYFMEQDDPQRKALALYLEGAINRDLKEDEKAMQFYLEAADEVERTADYQLGYLINLAVGQLYIYRDLYEYAEKSFECVHRYAKLLDHKNNVVTSFLWIARVYAGQEDWNTSIEYYKKAIDVAQSNNNDNILLGRIIIEMSSIYKYKGDYDMALHYALDGYRLKNDDDVDSTPNYLTIGDIYRLLEKADSAYYYLNKAALSENIYTKMSAYGALFVLSRSEKKYEDALEYVEQFKTYEDSIRNQERTNALIEIQEKYNKEKLLNEKNQLKIENDRTLRTNLSILILLLCIIAVLIYFYQRKLLRKERTIQKNEELLRLYTLKIHENEVLINLNKSRIHELSIVIEQNKDIQELLGEQESSILEIQNQNETLRRENETLQKNICQYSSTLHEKSKELDMMNVLTEENLRLRDRERFLSNQLLKKIKVLNDLKVSPKYLELARWEEVFEAVDWLYDGYTKRLTKELPSLTESDLQICCLIKLHIAIPEIATLLGISPTSVSKRKLRLKERIIQELKKPLSENKSLDLWLWEF